MNSENKCINIFSSYDDLARGILDYFINFIRESLQQQDKVNIVISGGSTPEKFFSLLWGEKIDWEKIHFFWADERCVPPDNPESNFGKALKLFLNRINIPPENIHSIQGDADPSEEIRRYGEDIIKNVLYTEDSSFDLALLGIGKDGHTASLFPEQELLQVYKDVCGIARHPATGQLRITLTYQQLCSSKNITFLVSGDKKSVMNEILNKKNKILPAAKINSCPENIKWFTDIDINSN